MFIYIDNISIDMCVHRYNVYISIHRCFYDPAHFTRKHAYEEEDAYQKFEKIE